jgi:hypothetical protein
MMHEIAQIMLMADCKNLFCTKYDFQCVCEFLMGVDVLTVAGFFMTIHGQLCLNASELSHG